MNEKKILFILIQIDEAHSTAWNVGLDHTPEPQKDIDDRLTRANKFVSDNMCPFNVYVDTWSNDFATCYRSWPDKYYCCDRKLTILHKSEYGTEGDEDARIIVDCLDLIKKIINE